MKVALDEVVRDEGTIVLFGGTTEDGKRVMVAVDQRLAQPICDAIAAGETPDVYAESWQVFPG